jgi:hypothetical protein
VAPEPPHQYFVYMHIAPEIVGDELLTLD